MTVTSVAPPALPRRSTRRVPTSEPLSGEVRATLGPANVTRRVAVAVFPAASVATTSMSPGSPVHREAVPVKDPSELTEAGAPLTRTATAPSGSLTEPERRLVAARAILGEWLAGSGGGWQDSGGVWPGVKLIRGELATAGDPEHGVSRGRLLPRLCWLL